MALTEKYGSKKAFKAAFKSSTGTNTGLFRRFKDGDRVGFRFLTEMEEWEKGFYHWLRGSDGKSQFLWCSRDDEECDGCQNGDRPKQIWLANALDIEAGKVQIVQVPFSIAKQLDQKSTNAGTIMDRVYYVSRSGTALNDTEYFLDWDDRSKFNPARYQVIDIGSAIMRELGLSEDDMQDEDEPRSAKKSKPTRNSKPARANHDDDWDDEDDDPEDAPPPKKRKPSGLDEFSEKTTRNPLPAKKKTSSAIKTSSTTKRVIRRSN